MSMFIMIILYVGLSASALGLGLDIVELLLINGANIHDDEALRLASGNGHLDVIELFNLRIGVG